jgi:hypothetical protein
VIRLRTLLYFLSKVSQRKLRKNRKILVASLELLLSKSVAPRYRQYAVLGAYVVSVNDDRVSACWKD